MYKLENVNVLSVLKKILDANTIGYKTDFDLDAEKIKDAAKRIAEIKPEERIFYWLSRRNGTWCFSESEVLLKDSQGYTTWTYYFKQEQDERPVMVMIDIKGYAKGVVTGDVYTTDYTAYCKYLMTAKLPNYCYEVTYEKCTIVYAPNKWFPVESSSYGKFIKFERKPTDKNLFEERVLEQKQMRKKAVTVESANILLQNLGFTKRGGKFCG